MRILAVLCLLLIAGCAANPEKVQQVAEAEASRLQAPSTALSNFSNYQLMPMSFDSEIEADKGKMREAKEFEENLRAKILPLLEDWAARSTGGEGKLLVEPQLKGLRIVGGGARFWVGALAGDSHIDMDLKLVNDQNGETVGDVRIYRTADSMTGGWSVGKSDQNLDEYVASIVHQYLTDNY